MATRTIPSNLHKISLGRSLDLKSVRAEKEFKDVPKSSVHYENVQTVYKAGIFDGKPDGTFGTLDKLTRAQMSKILVNALDLKVEKGYVFDDILESHWYKDYVTTLYTNVISTGSNGKYLPNQSVTRAQYAAFLYRSLHPDKVSKPSKPLQSTPPVVAKPEPKPPLVKPAQPSKPFQSIGVPPGAKVTSDDQYYTFYDYKKKLSADSLVYKVNYQKIDNSFAIYSKDLKGKETYAKYYPDDDKISWFMLSSAPVVQSEINELYEIGRLFASYNEKN